MPPSKRRGSRVIYVASSARELPEEVQDWLGQAGNRASASPNIYDALALLATGSKPAALIVSIDAVDFSEMEFFDLVARLSGETRVYVTGYEHQQAKIEAACAHGAQPFDPDALSDDLDTAPARTEAFGSGGLLAGSLRAMRPPREKPFEQASGPRAAETAEPLDEDAPDRRPAVRLVTESETADDNEAPLPAPVPWAPNPSRPKRTPPQLPAAGEKTSAGSSGACGADPAAAQRVSPVELTPEELAALLGKGGAPDRRSVKEQRQ